jgi:hypothetical protein
VRYWQLRAWIVSILLFCVLAAFAPFATGQAPAISVPTKRLQESFAARSHLSKKRHKQNHLKVCAWN